MKRGLQKFWDDAQGQDTVEYALTVGIVAAAAMAASPQFCGTINNVFSRIASIVASAVI